MMLNVLSPMVATCWPSASSSASFRTQLNNKPPPIAAACLSRSGAAVKHNQLLNHHPDDDTDNRVHNNNNKKKKERVFFLDVNPICYNGSTPSLHSFARWISLFFSQVSLTHPVIAVIDGEGAHEYRRRMLPSYKAHRRKFSRWVSASQESAKAPVQRSHQLISDTLNKCNVPVVKIPAQEADDVVATLVEQVLHKGYHAVIASPDKDFKQLICKDVQLVMPLPELKRWSFYTLDHYIAQYKCDPLSDLSLRCIMGDEADGVPGIQHLVPGFGMKTALKLLKKHGSLDNLLNAAAVRTVGKPYIQDALTKHACHLRKNYDVLSLRRDVNVRLQEDWLQKRPADNDMEIISNFIDMLGRNS
uniref:5'-3' exonuclease n=1 Tax=Erigeron canadensis TaxID=72917 RepID=UPI001CB96E3C|nr:5'-3' exonuclease [Erigeron canadensis]